MKTHAHYSKERRSFNISEGLCIHSCGSPSADNSGQCPCCAEKNRVKNRNRYRLAHGIKLNTPLWKRATKGIE